LRKIAENNGLLDQEEKMEYGYDKRIYRKRSAFDY